MNISEIKNPNYEYIELDLLNLPRALSTNLNEDSDNQKENVIPLKPNKRFRSQVSVKAVVNGTQRIWFIFSTILFEYTQGKYSHNTVKVFGGICLGALSPY
jgi:hypothetical protein